MATRPEELQNWTLWDFDENPVFKFQTGNPTYGYGGGTLFSQQMEGNDQTAAITLTEDGQLNFFNDETITITGGIKKTSGECVNIVGAKRWCNNHCNEKWNCKNKRKKHSN